MSLAYTPDRLQLPDTLQAQMHEFRRRVWMIKTIEAVAAAANADSRAKVSASAFTSAFLRPRAPWKGTAR